MAASRSAKVIILSSGQVATSLVGILSAAVLTRLFSKLDYATYRQTMLAFALASPFAIMGLDRAPYYFLPLEKDRSRGVLVENLLLLLAGGLLLTLFILGGGNHLLAQRFHNPDLASMLLLLAPYPLLMLPSSSLNACLMARERTEQVAWFNVASRLTIFLIVVSPCLVWPWPSTAIQATVCGAAVSTAAALALMFRACPTGDWRPTLSGLRRQLSFGIPLGLTGLAGTLFYSVDQVLVSARCSPEAFAVYTNGAMEIPLISVITGSIASVVMVDYARLYHEGRTAEIVNLIHRVMIKSGLLLLPAMFFLLCMAPELMRLLFGQPYEESAVPFRIYLLALPIRTLSFGAVLMATGHSLEYFLATLYSLVVNVVLVWCAIGMFGYLGAAWGFLASTYLIDLPYIALVLRRILKTPIRRLFPWNDFFKLGATSAVGVVGVLLLKHLAQGWPDLLVFSAALAVYGLVTMVLFAAFGWINLAAMLDLVRKQIAKKMRAD